MVQFEMSRGLYTLHVFGVPFPLTLNPSPLGRGKQPMMFWRKSRFGGSSLRPVELETLKLCQNRAQVLPLPKGEGRGEGERRANQEQGIAYPQNIKMNRFIYIALVALVATCLFGFAADAKPPVKWHPGHYIFVGHGEIKAEHILKHFRGIQKCYAWTKLESAQGQYDFSSIRNDLALLKQHHQQLVIQIQYKAFGKGQRFVPAYLQGAAYGGGVYLASSGSFDPVLWNVKVGERMDALFAALGREFDLDPGVEAAVLPETSPSAALEKFPQPGVDPYTTAIYVEALKKRMTALRQAFTHTVVIQYANFPQQALPQLTAYMKDIGVGLGGPDVYPRPSNLSDPEKGVYRLYAPLAGAVPLGAAVQSPDYSVALWKRTAAFNRGQDRNSVTITPEEETPIPPREFLKLAQEKLKLNYLFWSTSPKACFENVKKFLAEPDLVNDPAGGLESRCPSKAFISVSAGTKLSNNP
jgi:hypothetical protein